MSSIDIETRLGPTLVDFAVNRTFPEEEDVSAAQVLGSALPAALKALNGATVDLETEICQISRDSAPNIDSWIGHAQRLQDDIAKSRKLASNIVRQAEADEDRLAKYEDAKFQAEFLQREVTFEKRLHAALCSIKLSTDTLDMVEEQIRKNRTTEALKKLEEARIVILDMPTPRSVAAVRLLHTRWAGLKGLIHEQFLHVWSMLVHFDSKDRTLSIHKELEGQETSLGEALLGLQEYDEIDDISKQFWQNLDELVLKPRTELRRGTLPSSISVLDNCLRLGESPADLKIESLFSDLEFVLHFLRDHLPAELITTVSNYMMPALFDRIEHFWLDNAVPTSLEELPVYQRTLDLVNNFADKLDSSGWPGVGKFHDWVRNAPRVWLNRRRESVLGWTRSQLALGLGTPYPAERVESQVVDREDQVHATQAGNIVVQDWDAAWDSGDEGHQATAMPNLSSLAQDNKINIPLQPDPSETEQDDAAEDWGWNAEDDGEDLESNPIPTNNGTQYTAHDREGEKKATNLRHVTLTEAYWTSSLPRPVLRTVVEILNDGATLLNPESQNLPINAAAPALFTLPTLVLALYRAVSPCYYADDPSGLMYLYNDSMWLADQLRKFAIEWSQRTDISPRAQGMVKVDGEIKALESFGKRAYTTELNLQRTLINDLLGGAQSLFQQDHAPFDQAAFSIDSVTQHIRDRHTLWKQILAPSVLASATGSLVNAVASKLITDVLDLPDISVDDAERTARLIDKVSQLDDLFLPEVEPRSELPQATSSQSHSSQDARFRIKRRPVNANGNGVSNRSNPALDPQSTSSSDPRATAPDQEDRIAMTPRFADKWLKMKFLGEVLQSNLRDIKYFWFESDLSLYFTKEEVVDLIKLSFENNAQVRQIVREIKESEVGS